MTEPDWMTPDPWEVEEDARRREDLKERHRQRQRKYRATESHIRQRRVYYRDYKRRLRLAQTTPTPDGYLHSLSCLDPNHRAKPSCRPLRGRFAQGEDAA